MSEHWSVTVSRSGEKIITIESKCLCGREISPEDESTIRTAALHLLSFIGDGDFYSARVAELEELLRGTGANRYWEGRYRDEAKRVAVLEGALRRLVWHFDKGYTPRRKDWEAARAALANAPACPAGGYTGQPSTEPATVENCLAAGVCGCDVGAAMEDAYARGHRDAIAECMARPMQWAGDKR